MKVVTLPLCHFVTPMRAMLQSCRVTTLLFFALAGCVANRVGDVPVSPSLPAPTSMAPTREVVIGRLETTLKSRNDRLAGWRFVIDPGHGGVERGAPSAISGNSSEADVNLAVGLLVGGMLEASGAEVNYTRKADVSVGTSETFVLRQELERRSSYANDLQPDFFLSIHHNSSPRSDVNRVEVYYKLFTHNPSRELARLILEQLGRVYPGFDTALLAGNFSVLRNLHGEGVLVECSYLSDTALAPKLETLALLKKEAVAIFEGLVAYAEASMPLIDIENDSDAAILRVRSHAPLEHVTIKTAHESIVRRRIFYLGDTSQYVFEERIRHDEYDSIAVDAFNTLGKGSYAVEKNPRLMRHDDTPLLVFVVEKADSVIANGMSTDGFRVATLTQAGNLSELSETLKQIEEQEPKFVMILARGPARSVVHYFRSDSGRKIAVLVSRLASSKGMMQVVAGSGYLLTHTSMPALVITQENFSADFVHQLGEVFAGFAVK